MHTFGWLCRTWIHNKQTEIYEHMFSTSCHRHVYVIYYWYIWRVNWLTDYYFCCRLASGYASRYTFTRLPSPEIGRVAEEWHPVCHRHENRSPKNCGGSKRPFFGAETRRNSEKTKTTGITTTSRLISHPRFMKFGSGTLELWGLINCAFWAIFFFSYACHEP